jgi:hypothetical protein
MGRVVSIPASFALGWLFKDFGAYWALRAIAVVAVVVLVYWLWASRKITEHNVPA